MVAITAGYWLALGFRRLTCRLCVRYRTEGPRTASRVADMTRAESEWLRLQTEYAIARVVYRLATEAVDRRSHTIQTMTAALLVEDQAREKLAEVRRRMHRFRPLRDGRSSFHRRMAQALST